jgi:hypothetical protein
VGEVLLVIGLLMLTAFVFAAWLVVRVVTWILGAIFGFGDRRQTKNRTAAGMAAAGDRVSCRNAGCRELNPRHAVYCRRCGRQVARWADVPRMRYVA